MVDFEYREIYGFEDLVKIVALLRVHCPWDREQTHQSVRRDFLEEVYEACEAIDSGDMDSLREELGDVLLQVVSHSGMESEAGGFDIGDVCDGICKKLIYRHPHIFADGTAKTTGEVLDAWDILKKKEKGQDTAASTLESVAKSLPALMRAEKLVKKAEKSGIDYSGMERHRDDDESAIGWELFELVEKARGLGIDPERALEKASEEFIRSFTEIESGR